MAEHIETLDLILSPDEHVEAELDERKFSRLSPRTGTIRYERCGVLYVHVQGITVCRIYGEYNNMSLKG